MMVLGFQSPYNEEVAIVSYSWFCVFDNPFQSPYNEEVAIIYDVYEMQRLLSFNPHITRKLQLKNLLLNY